MKFNRHSEKITMTRFMMAALLLAVSVLPASAAGTYEATVGARLIDLDFRGSRGQVQEYDGKVYTGAHGDVSVSNQGSDGLFDVSLKDIGSTEENGYLNIDYKSSFKMSAKWENMHHRTNYQPSGLVINGAYQSNPTVVFAGADRDENLMIRRTESEIKVGLFDSANSARFITGQYWSVDKKGKMVAKFAGGTTSATTFPYIWAADVDNTKQDIILGLGTNLQEAGAMSVDVIRTEFQDNARSSAPATITYKTDAFLPTNGRQTMTAAEAMFRYDVSKTLAVTGAFTGRQRENLESQYKMNAAVAALNAAYKASQKLTLTARFYARVMEIDENTGFVTPGPINILATETLTPGRTGRGSEIDKTTVRGELIANYRPVEKVRLQAAYKAELNHRRDAPSMNYPLASAADAYYFDGSRMYRNDFNNDVAREDIKHTVKLSGKVELPFGMEVEGDYQRMQATRAAFVNQPNWQDDMNATFSAALPHDVEFTLMGGYLRERNTRSVLTQYNSQRNTYRTGLDWAGSSKVSLGADASYERTRSRTNGWVGTGGTIITGFTTGSTYVNHGMLNSQRNTTTGAHARINLPKGVCVKANGSYTWSVVQVPMNFFNTPNAFSVGDLAPSEIRIARGTVAVEYTPEMLKNLTARASYSIDDYVDLTETLNSGRASVAALGASMKF